MLEMLFCVCEMSIMGLMAYPPVTMAVKKCRVAVQAYADTVEQHYEFEE